MAFHWIWQQPDWPGFYWQAETLAPLLRECVQTQGQLLGMAGAVTTSLSAQNELDALLQNIVTSSAIEGEQLNVGSVRSSLARRLGLEQGNDTPVSQRSEGLANLLLDATRHFNQPLTIERLLEWHEWLFPDQTSHLAHRQIRVGALRGDEPMQVVSGRLDRPTVHFEAPPRQGLEQQLQTFVDWFEASRHQAELDPLLRAGIAHFWFVTLHPFDDGNGRLTRTLTDLALAQGEAQAIRFYAMSVSILEDRAGYYRILESSQKATLDITAWLIWFLQTLLRSLHKAMTQIESVLGKTRFWQAHRASALTPEQTKVLNRLLDGGEKGFEQGINAAQYQAVAKVSKATATRHLTELLEKGCLERMPGGGRSTRYRINYPDA
ncbi:Fic family protein [Pseudomonas beijingensis]|uniref:Fic family protein n=1 Tax=Pseudomonas beijingensis TaxID=2954101 RepID=A0ABY9FAT5_9PSED|nr:MULTISPECIES: Fic family protein [unclassified Pseudomonas]WLH00604.1 Fic family protein [Pseudomonas sp. FP2034]WLI44759.1 Fic family protein [Pseudomonas sp. FP830]